VLLNILDIAFVTVILLSAIIGFFRGLVREIMSLLGWIVSIWLAWVYAPRLAYLFESLLQSPDVRQAAAFVSIFLLTLVLFAVLSYLISKVITTSALKGTDRTLGILFGALRGALIVAVIVVLINSSPFAKEGWWAGSALKGYFLQLAAFVISLLPAEVGRFFGQRA